MTDAGERSRRLTRSRTDKRIAGVCGGMAEYFAIDPLIVRIGFVVAAIAGGPGVLAYLILWFALPVGPPGGVEASGDGTGTWSAPASSAIRIAEERYARGEIGADELARIRKDLA